MQKNPIIIVHFSGGSKNIKYIVRHLIENNPGRRIILISDKILRVKELECYYLQDFSIAAAAFAQKQYVHLSSNRYDFELFALQRWFIINEFVRKNRIKRFIAIDPDVMFFPAIADFEKIYADCDFTVSHGVCPHIFYVKDHEKLTSFLNYIVQWYTPKNKKILQARYQSEFVTTGLKGGIGDMTFLGMYVKKHPEAFGDIAIPRKNCVCDHSLITADGYVFDVRRKIKKIIWKNKIPYVVDEHNKRIRLLAIHFQGNAKRLIPEVYHSGLLKFLFFLKNRIYETLLAVIKW